MVTTFIERLLTARTVPDIKKTFLEAAGTFGFEHVYYAARFMLTVPSAIFHEPPVIISRLPAELRSEVRNLRNPETDGWVHWVTTHDGEISSADLVRQWPSPLLDLAGRHGLGAMQILSLRNKVMHSNGGLLLNPYQGADHQVLAQRWEQSGREMQTLCWVMHMRLATIARTAPLSSLTPRQREVLAWRSAGKTVGEVATILGITPATVEKHMRLAREALGVDTTQQAVLKAHVTHQLYRPDLGSGG